MLNFEGEKLSPLISRRTFFRRLNTCSLAVCTLVAIIAATLSATLENIIYAIAVIALFAALMLSLAIVNLTAVKKCSQSLKLEICRVIAEGLCARKDVLETGETVLLNVSYTGDEVTAESVQGEVSFDLTALKRVPSFYSSFGAYLLEFFRGYYLYGEGEYGTVTVTDSTAGKPYDVEIIKDGKPAGKGKVNYFKMKELI